MTNPTKSTAPLPIDVRGEASNPFAGPPCVKCKSADTTTVHRLAQDGKPCDRIIATCFDCGHEWDPATPAPSADGAVREAQACETCCGAGTIDERLGGYDHSNPAAQCPDCDGTGSAAPSPAPQQVPALTEALETLTAAKDAIVDIRDCVLNERNQLAEEGAGPDVINAVLGIIDDHWPDARVAETIDRCSRVEAEAKEPAPQSSEVARLREALGKIVELSPYAGELNDAKAIARAALKETGRDR